ncbi:6-phosphogluconolactonase [Acrasis kona]|uniref:6-phosphogluconolactonase n=1 Tax=Acrasis kona TaxID=1008807 RepID=A0AAW2Z811_9EUKA
MMKIIALATLCAYVAAATVYVGTWAESIYVLDFDESSGSINLRSQLNVGHWPSYVVLDPNGKTLYTVNEDETFRGQPKTGGLLSYSISEDGKSLTPINAFVSNGTAPCFLDVSRDSNHLLVANYGGSTFVTAKLRDGKIVNVTQVIKNTGRGPNPDRQEAPHPHQLTFDPTNRFAYGCDLGLDRVFFFTFDHSNNKLVPNVNQAYLSTAPGSGPRHIAFHPRLPIVYLTHELDSTVSTLKFDQKKGIFSSPVQTLSMLPSGVDPKSCSGAEVRVSPDGLFVYTSNRGVSNTITVYKVNQNDGSLSLVGFQEAAGEFPRFFLIDETGRWLIVSNQNSDNVIVFRRDSVTGMLSKVSSVEGIKKPTALALKL